MALTFLSKVVPESWIPYLKFVRAPWNFHLLQKDKFHYATDKLYTEVNTEFKQDPRFARAYQWVTKLGGSLVPKNGMEWRIYMLCWAADQVKNLPGDFVPAAYSVVSATGPLWNTSTSRKQISGIT
ncbi:hypothetical protein BWI96_16150 [Siphonobacter sp. SORGH_AS_0500]|uniref:hypothetical protein n=1 Tax=Siphonobacter sp. SORGH_AS_0500 TaxID=1864824 RepID=UPI000CC6BE12|nr:hypothetical protein [Siphonobacter sp. SORGH_AS_0500]PKK35630.1 hypothetical protein BWI96_16150 [Siphonobacter sp. SORGH_AS_0500]